VCGLDIVSYTKIGRAGSRNGDDEQPDDPTEPIYEKDVLDTLGITRLKG
jgi:hypothetical protein